MFANPVKILGFSTMMSWESLRLLGYVACEMVVGDIPGKAGNVPVVEKKGIVKQRLTML